MGPVPARRYWYTVSRLMPNSRARPAFAPRPGTFPQLSHPLVGQRAFAAAVGAPGLGQRDTFPLPFPDQRPLELGERAHHRQQQLRHRVVLTGERQLLLDELRPHPPPTSEVADDPPEVDDAISTKRSISLSCGRSTSLPDKRSMNVCSSGIPSSWRAGFCSRLLTR